MGVKTVREHRNRNPKIKKGDKYTVSNEMLEADVDGDSSEDLQLTHSTKRNQEKWLTIQVTWHGIDPETANSFKALYADIMSSNTPMKNLGNLISHWKKLNNKMTKVTDVGAMMAESIGEPADE